MRECVCFIWRARWASITLRGSRVLRHFVVFQLREHSRRPHITHEKIATHTHTDGRMAIQLVVDKSLGFSFLSSSHRFNCRWNEFSVQTVRQQLTTVDDVRVIQTFDSNCWHHEMKLDTLTH